LEVESVFLIFRAEPLLQEFDAVQVRSGSLQARDHDVREAILGAEDQGRLGAVDVGVERRLTQLI
jgi:hypothetical protein